MARNLVVEDDEMNRDMLSRRLERKGFQILLAVNGREAVNKTQAENPDLILMDLSMPVLDGYEATRILKADPATQKIPIIGLSAHAMVVSLISYCINLRSMCFRILSQSILTLTSLTSQLVSLSISETLQRPISMLSSATKHLSSLHVMHRRQLMRLQ